MEDYKKNINGEEIYSFPEDTKYQFINRVAVHFKTLPRFMSEIKDGNVLLLEKMVKKEKSITTFKEFFEKNKENFPDPSIVAELWLLNDKESESQKFLGYKEMKDILKKTTLNVDEYNENIYERKEKLKQEKSDLKSIVDEQDEIYKQIMDQKKPKNIQFIPKGHTVSLDTSIKNRSLDYIFNSIECTGDIPFFCYKNFCKIKTGFSLENVKEWSELDENQDNEEKILLKIKIGNSFLNGYLSLTNELLQFTIDSTIGSIDSIKDNVSAIFPKAISFKNERKLNIRGLIMFPEKQFLKFVMSDIIMNNKIISLFVSVDEKDKATTKKTGLLLKYKGGTGDKDSSCNVISKKVIQNDIDSKELLQHDKDKKIKIGDNFIRISVNNFKDTASIDRFIIIFSKILTIYEETEAEIINEYKRFIPDIQSFIKQENEIEQKKETIKDKAPFVFSSNYTRCCERDRLPLLLKKDEIDASDVDKYMKFPKDNHFDDMTFENRDAENKYKEQFYYYCPDNPDDKKEPNKRGKVSKNYPYIGLVERNNNCKDDYYKYMPCCFETKQGTEKNINDYFLGKKEKKQRSNQQVLKTIHHLLHPSTISKRNLGEIPVNLKYFFQTFYKDEIDCEFLRMGAIRDPTDSNAHSFLSCVKTATGKNINIKRFYVALQENYDLSIDEMSQMFKNKNVYMDPRRWIRLLEYYYECNIVLFSYRNNANYSATYIEPKHKGPYLQYKPLYRDTIYILENHDNEIRCELLVKKKAETYTYLFPHKKEHFITQFYLEQSTKNVVQYSKRPPTTINYKGQILDSFNKTRGFLTEKDIVLLCDPIPPIDLPVVDNDEIYLENDLENIKSDKLLSKMIKENENDDIKHGMFTIKIKKEEDVDAIDNYIIVKKIAHILGEYFIYRYSCFCREKHHKEYTIQSIKEFIDENVSISGETPYKIINSSVINEKLMKKAGYVNDENKIIVENNETLKRLICLLRLCIMNYIKKVETYCEKQEFYSFYDSITDYKQTDKSRLFYLSDIITFQNVKHIVYSTLQPLSSYYFIFRGKIVFAEEVTSIENDNDNDKFLEYDKNFKIINQSVDTKEDTLNIKRYVNVNDKLYEIKYV
jgi:hypothetical protein